MKGGLQVEWLGYFLDYGLYRLGISQARSEWLICWGEKVLQDGMVGASNLAEGVGRLSFTSGVAEWGKPYLAPLYALTAVMPKGSVISLPPLELKIISSGQL